MGDAFTQTCEELGLKDRKDPLTEFAHRIIELAQQGATTKAALYALTVQEFKPTPH